MHQFPERMVTCKHCKEHITSRLRPLDDERVVVTATQAQDLHQQQQCLDDWTDLLVRLENLIGSSVTLDPRWDFDPHLVVQERIAQVMTEQSEKQDWAHYRDALFLLGEALMQQGGILTAVGAYCKAAYLALNGPERAAARHGQFSIKERTLPALFVERLMEYLSIPGHTDATLRSAFLEAAKDLRHLVSLPVSPEVGWRQTAEALRAVEPERDDPHRLY